MKSSPSSSSMSNDTCHLLKLVQTGIIIFPILQSGMNIMDVSLIYKQDWVAVNFVLSGWSQVQYAQNVYSSLH